MPSTNETTCAFCGLPPRIDAAGTPIKMKSCSRCKAVFYHDVECQRQHWKVHKKLCGKPKSVPGPTQKPTPNHRSMNSTHRLVTRRYKQLRKQGLTTHEAMERARDEFQPASEEHEMDAGSQVAAMFGMR